MLLFMCFFQRRQIKSCENKNVVFRTRDKNSAINILNLTECWINNQTRPVEFQCEVKASSFTCVNKKQG